MTKDNKMEERWTKVKDTVSKVNKVVLESTEDIVDSSLKTGERWQGVAEKATKGGFELSARQADIMFDTLETLKKQMKKNAPRFRKLFSLS